MLQVWGSFEFIIDSKIVIYTLVSQFIRYNHVWRLIECFPFYLENIFLCNLNFHQEEVLWSKIYEQGVIEAPSY